MVHESQLAGLQAALAAVAALHARERDGIGETVDISLVESVFSLLEGTLPEYKHAGKIARRSGNKLATTAPSNIYPTSDGEWIAIAIPQGLTGNLSRRMTLSSGRRVEPVPRIP